MFIKLFLSFLMTASFLYMGFKAVAHPYKWVIFVYNVCVIGTILSGLLAIWTY